MYRIVLHVTMAMLIIADKKEQTNSCNINKHATLMNDGKLRIVMRLCRTYIQECYYQRSANIVVVPCLELTYLYHTHLNTKPLFCLFCLTTANVLLLVLLFKPFLSSENLRFHTKPTHPLFFLACFCFIHRNMILLVLSFVQQSNSLNFKSNYLTRLKKQTY